MKKMMLLLLFVLAAQAFTSCKKQEMTENANTHQTIQADDYGGDDELEKDKDEGD